MTYTPTPPVGEQLTPEAVEWLEKLAVAAQAETSGAWWLLNDGEGSVQVRDQTGSLLVAVEIGGDDLAETGATVVSDYIAAVDPPTCLALLSRIRADAERIKALEGQNTALRKALAGAREGLGIGAQWANRPDRQNARTKIKAALDRITETLRQERPA